MYKNEIQYLYIPFFSLQGATDWLLKGTQFTHTAAKYMMAGTPGGLMPMGSRGAMGPNGPMNLMGPPPSVNASIGPGMGMGMQQQGMIGPASMRQPMPPQVQGGGGMPTVPPGQQSPMGSAMMPNQGMRQQVLTISIFTTLLSNVAVPESTI